MATKPEGWWDERLKDKATFEFFKENLGGVNMPSRVAVRELAMVWGITSVLDVGCGPAIDRWLETGIKWHGVDPSKVIGDDCFFRGISIDHAPAHLLPYRNASFDLVHSRHVWEHLPHWKHALPEACRVAKRGVIITFFRPPGNKEEIRITDGAYYNDYSLDEIVAAFQAEWPQCTVTESRLAPQKFLPDGEVILAVWK